MHTGLIVNEETYDKIKDLLDPIKYITIIWKKLKNM